jgi:cell division protein FtsZ
MTINLTVPKNMQELRPRITVVGVGGAGCNAVNNMIEADLEGVDFLVLNTDGQALAHSKSDRKIQLGSAITQGLGAGSKPEIGRAAAEESLQEVMSELADCNMVFITAGMGGGTGTGAAPVLARAARERGILTVGVVTKPFEFEGQRRMKQAEDGIEELQAYVDTLIIIPNQNLFRLANERTTFADAFHMADTVLHQGVCGVTDLMIKPGQINLDFADIRSVMGEMGKAMMGTGEASGETRATQAAEAAINNPLLDDTNMKGANAVLINITGGLDMTLFEVDEAANRIRKEVDPDATIIFGSAFDDKLDGIMRVSVVATGISGAVPNVSRPLSSRPANIMQPEINTILPNPPANFTTEPLKNEPDPTVISSEAAPEAFSATHGSTDFANQISNEIAGEAIANKLYETTGSDKQMHINDLVDAQQDVTDDNHYVKNMGDNSMLGSPSEIGGSSEIPLMPADALTSKGKPEVGAPFIPAAPASFPDEEMVADAAKTATQRPTSLINKISGLWSSKPSTTDFSEETKVSSVKDEARYEQTPVSIFDLSRNEQVDQKVKDSISSASNTNEDDLDIPAFLRRQAN